MELNPDGVLFVGDLSDGDLRIVRGINKISIPTSVVLGNHDRGRDGSGNVLQAQLDLLGEKNCSWNLSKWTLDELSVVGARPCSGGGGFFLTRTVPLRLAVCFRYLHRQQLHYFWCHRRWCQFYFSISLWRFQDRRR